ncbi:MAG: hypothetical protein Q9201_002125 [Fulgogasparrea decipioides]
MISNYASIPQLRLDKYLYLMRLYVRDSFQYLRYHDWEAKLVERWIEVMEDGEKGRGEDGKEEVDRWLAPLSPGDGKVPDGVRYHVCDVWMDELVHVVGEDELEDLEKKDLGVMLMAPIRRLEREGRTKILRGRAREVLKDERIKGWGLQHKEKLGDDSKGEDEWAGFED